MWLLFGSCCSASGQRPSRERARHGSEVSESAPQPGRTENLQAAEPSGLFGYGTAVAGCPRLVGVPGAAFFQRYKVVISRAEFGRVLVASVDFVIWSYDTVPGASCGGAILVQRVFTPS